MPSYFTSELHFDMTTAGLLCMVPYFSMFIFTAGGGRVFEELQFVYYWKVKSVRQCAEFIALGIYLVSDVIA